MNQLNLFDSERSHVEKNKITWHLFVDGASRNNPGPAGAGVYLVHDAQGVYRHGFFLGHRTNNQAEYLALLLGLFYCRKHMNPGDHLAVFSDSELLINQMKGVYKVRDPFLKELFGIAQLFLNDIPHTMAHISREKNAQADAMANAGIDKKKHMPVEFIKIMRSYGIEL